jgi:sulfate adenylyltransferase subunit 1 (EFTu-like GTPase family)
MTQITVVQILRNEDLEYKKIILNNSLFLNSLDVEYVIYDNLKSSIVLKFIKDVKRVKYFRKDFASIKQSFLESGLLASGEKIIYLKSDDSLSMENIEKIEKERPNIFKSELKKISKIKKVDFKYADFNLLIKENKTFFEKLKLLF